MFSSKDKYYLFRFEHDGFEDHVWVMGGHVRDAQGKLASIAEANFTGVVEGDGLWDRIKGIFTY